MYDPSIHTSQLVLPLALKYRRLPAGYVRLRAPPGLNVRALSRITNKGASPLTLPLPKYKARKLLIAVSAKTL